MLRERVARRRQRKRRLSGSGRRDREEVLRVGRDEAVEGGLLPRSEANDTSHGSPEAGGRYRPGLTPYRARNAARAARCSTPAIRDENPSRGIPRGERPVRPPAIVSAERYVPARVGWKPSGP